MSEFYDLALTQLQDDDFLLVGRGSQPYRASVSQLARAGEVATGGAIAYSETPPNDKALWWQMSDGLPVDFWMLRPGGLWVSDEVIRVSHHEPILSSGGTQKYGLPEQSLWLDSFSIRGVGEDAFSAGQKWRIEFAFINSDNQQTGYYFLELEGIGLGEIFEISEFAGESLPLDGGFALWIKVSRINSVPRVRNVTITAKIRRLYDAQSQ
ncbi:hypothetical protein [cf. Phormidesmis sp. LEGE 11477]|uniref:hypothetical protein n=1 Tax=cf. Phormidesmis sp. LEGE 11477 TaxID=1828680 RepID=UPI0018817980|nr:hypothetical protein [cf. Phormidesmis sp. LEGE 11477]MBE9061860.1 hypothetical protein [cf. Phormidesmis sp. LEGE 11477]